MKKIQAEGTTFAYWTRADGIPKAIEMGLQVKGLEPFMATQLGTCPEIRLILIRLLDLHIAYIRYLYWDNEQDLDILDDKVVQGKFTDDDFKDAVKTVYQRTVCSNCGYTWDTLVMPPEPYLGSPGLFEKKLAEKVPKLKTCPNCGASLRQLVVKIF